MGFLRRKTDAQLETNLGLGEAMNELRRIVLTLTLMADSETEFRSRRLAEISGYVLGMYLDTAERALLEFVSIKSVHPVNRSRGYSALSKIAGLMCLTRDERDRIKTDYEKATNEEKTNPQP